MVSTPKVAENLAAAAVLVAEAAAQGAKLVALPEYFCILGMRDTDKVASRRRTARARSRSSLRKPRSATASGSREGPGAARERGSGEGEEPAA